MKHKSVRQLSFHRVTGITGFVPLLLFVLAGVLLTTDIQAQRSLKEIKKKAQSFYKEENYKQAVNYFYRYNQYKSGDSEIQKKLAICQYYTGDLKDAQLNFAHLDSLNENAGDPELNFYYGLTLKNLHQFSAAAEQFKKSLKNSGNRSSKNSELIRHIKNCAVGMDLKFKQGIGFIENLGPIVNSTGDDIAPVYSENIRDRIYFASNFDRHEALPQLAHKSLDIYSTELIQGNWSDPVRFSDRFSTQDDEIPLALFNDGRVLYFQRGSMNGASILIDSFSNNKSNIDSLEEFGQSDAPVFMELGDRNVYNFADSIIVFSSRRPGGFGGYDIYYTIRKAAGWSAPENIGPVINSNSDEIDPFLAKDGNTLFFSSNREEGIGGYDIFRSYIKIGSREWSNPENVGLPVNSPANDRHAQISEDGTSMILSSDRQTGYGKHDLYIVYIDTSAVSPEMKVNRSLPAFIANPDIIVVKTDSPDIYEVVSPVVDSTTLNADELVEPDTSAIEEIVDEETITEPPIEETETAPIEQEIKIVDEKLFPKKTIDVYSIYYSENDVVLNPQSIKGLNQIADILQQYPQLHIQFFSHSSTYNGPIYFDLYFTVKRAEQVVNYLIEQGLSPDRMSIVGVGSQFPYAGNEIDKDLAGFSDKLNRRIEFFLHNGENYNLTFQYLEGGLEDEYLDDRNKQMKNLRQGVSFKVEIKTVSQVFKDPVLKQFSYPMIESFSKRNQYHYTLGWTRSYDEAARLKQLLRKRKYSDARVIAYVNGARISESRAKRLARTDQELKKWLKDN